VLFYGGQLNCGLFWIRVDKMNMEHEIKSIIRGGGTNEQKAELISKMSTLSKEETLKGLNKYGERTSDVYWNILLEHKKEQGGENE